MMRVFPEQGKHTGIKEKKTENWKQIYTRLGETANDEFGKSVAISGNYAIVGATGNDDGGSGAGKVYWYQREKDGNWKQVHTEIGEAVDDGFGHSVAISGNYSIVGATGNDEGGNLAGKVYWYRREKDGNWKQVHTEIGEAAVNFFGGGVSISGNYAIIGAYGFFLDSAFLTGKAYWYQREKDGNWKQVHTEIGEAAGDYFGFSVALDGNYAIISGSQNDEGGNDAGKAYWYQRESNGKWKQIHTEIGEAVGDRFGYSVAISGNYSIVSAPDNGEGGTDAGKAYWYQRESNGKWKQIYTRLGEAGSDEFGSSVTISGNYAIVGALKNNEGGPDAGKSYFYFKKY